MNLLVGRWLPATVAAASLMLMQSVVIDAQWQNRTPRPHPTHNSAIISNGTIQLGVNDEGHLNVGGGSESSGEYPTTVVGLRYVPTNGEATAPGCLCEGWGAADAISGVTGYANIDSDAGVHNITLESFTATASTATSVVNIQGVLSVIHFYHPSTETPFLYEADVTIRNISASDVDLRYRRVMDWDIQPNTFSEHVTIQGTSTSPAVLFASNDGFATANPLGARSDLGSVGDFVDAGPADHGALFDFTLGIVKPGEARVFTIFYGAAGNEGSALAAIAAARAEVYSLGQPDVDPSGGTPNTYIFGFAVSKDSDGDGLFDLWEENGALIDPDAAGPLTPQFIDLPAMGADSQKPDIFIQLDWMADATHSHELQAAAIRTVADAFAASPYTSPTGSVGINFHVDQGPGSVMNFSTGATWGTLSRARALTHVAVLGSGSGSYNWSDFAAIKDGTGGFTETGRRPIFHYTISGHNYGSTTSSGISRGIGASDLLVTLGSFTGGVGTTSQQAGTLMHELGHNLGLRHGGGDDANYKPNFLSIMSYWFQMAGVPRTGTGSTFDYSRTTLPTLDETALDETVGLGPGAAGLDTFRRCAAMGSRPVRATNPAVSVDWNCDGDALDNPVSENINGGPETSLAGFDDWTNLKLKVGAIGLPGALADLLPMETEEEILTPELEEELQPIVDTTAPTTAATLSVEPNANGWHNANVTVLLSVADEIGGTGVRDLTYRAEGAQSTPATTLLGAALDIDITAEGVTTIFYSARDIAGNVAAEQSITVRVDRTSPAITVPADITVPATSALGAVVNYSATATDLLDPSVSVSCIPSSGSTFAPGTTTVHCTATDHAGNTSTAEFVVTVTALQAQNGLMFGVGRLEAGNKHHHFAFGVSRLLNRNVGRLEYWVSESSTCIDDDDDLLLEHQGDYQRKNRKPFSRFEATSITSMTFSDDPAFQPDRSTGDRRAKVDTVRFSGTGKWNGKPGYTFEALATDRGEPGRHRDTFSLLVRGSHGNIVANVSGSLDRGEIQSIHVGR